MSCAGGNDYNRNCAATRNQLAPLSGRRAAYGDSGRGAERHRTRNLLLWPRRPVVRQCAGVIGKTGGLAAGHGTLEWSLGFVTRDSPNGFVCSSSPRAITPQPSPCLTRNAAKTIAVGGRVHYGVSRFAASCRLRSVPALLPLLPLQRQLSIRIFSSFLVERLVQGCQPFVLLLPTLSQLHLGSYFLWQCLIRTHLVLRAVVIEELARPGLTAFEDFEKSLNP